MGFREVLQRMKEKKQEKKQMFRQMEDQQRIEKLLEEKSKSANLRELERYYKEDKEMEIKKQLEIM